MKKLKRLKPLPKADIFILFVYISTYFYLDEQSKWNAHFEITFIYFFWFILLWIGISIYYLIFKRLPFIDWNEDFQLGMSVMYSLLGTILCYYHIESIQTIYTEKYGTAERYIAKIVEKNEYEKRTKSNTYKVYYIKTISDKHYFENIRVHKEIYDTLLIGKTTKLIRIVSSQGYYVIVDGNNFN